jgi:general secretion pathway protein F
MLLLFVGSLVLALLLGVVVPRFASLVDMNGRDLPWMSRQLMDWGRWASANSTAALALGASCALAVAWALWRLRDPALRRRWLARLPMVASLARDFQHLQMYRTAAILTSRGIPVQKALSMSCELLSDSDRARLEQAVLRMQEGASVSDALSSCGISDVVAASMLNVAEKTGAMPTMLDRIADFYEQSLRRNIEIVSRLIEPAMMIGFGIVIGGIVILMYLPIFDLASSIS